MSLGINKGESGHRKHAVLIAAGCYIRWLRWVIANKVLRVGQINRSL